MSKDVKKEYDLKENISKFTPFIKQTINKYSKVRFYDEKEIISWAQQGIMEALDNIPEDCKNVNSYIMSYITNYVKLGLRESGHFIKLKSKFATKDPEIRKINNIASLDGQINNKNSSVSSFIEIMPSAILPPDKQFEEKEQCEIINGAVNALRDDYATIVREYIYKGRTFADIANDLGITKQGTEQKYKKALKLLRLPLENV